MLCARSKGVTVDIIYLFAIQDLSLCHLNTLQVQKVQSLSYCSCYVLRIWLTNQLTVKKISL